MFDVTATSTSPWAAPRSSRVSRSHVPAGETHAIMGPNGSGKSTLAYALGGRDSYEVTSGAATLDGVDLLALTPEAARRAGLFLSFQYPVEIPGLSAIAFLKAALNAQRKARGAGADAGAGAVEAAARQGGGAEDRCRIC